ncbi:MAG: EamA family transporter [Armatimonadetes bacterium]|nr:EamA family transporter [Armatimonadota bacterium]
MPQAPAWKIAAAFAAVYILWGSTYLAIRYAVVSVPPLAMASMRFLLAGSILLLFSKLKGDVRATKLEWRNSAIVGTLMLLGGNGIVCWSEQRVSSGIAALMVASVSLWLVVLNWLIGKNRPTVSQTAGLFAGLSGVALLVSDSLASKAGQGAFVGTLMLVLGSLFWAAGTLFSRYNPMPSSGVQSSGMQMVTGGISLATFSLLTGEGPRLMQAQPNAAALFSFGYLVIFGSVVAFSAYNWLNGVTTPARLGTYAFVNPAVAVLMGSLVAHEAVTVRELIAMIVILGAVMLLSVKKAPAPAKLAQATS